MKIYVASSWRNAFQPEVVEILRLMGHEVYDFRNPPNRSGFAWSEIDPNWENWTSEEYKAALDHPLAEAGFNSDFDGMKWADVCVMVLPCGRSANTEAGWMKGAGKKVYALQPTECEPELMYKIYDGVLTGMEDLKIMFGVGMQLILKERQEHTDKHNWNENDHGEYWKNGELVKAALFAIDQEKNSWPDNWLPYFRKKIISKNRVEQLKVAGSLYLADMERTGKRNFEKELFSIAQEIEGLFQE